MMTAKKFHFLLFILFSTLLISCNAKIQVANKANQIDLVDGIYLIEKKGNTAKEILPIASHEKIIVFNKEFIEKTEPCEKYLVVNSNEFAPLQLKHKPATENQADNRKKLMLTLSDEAAQQLQDFSARNLNKLTSIVVNGEALTMHKVRTVLEGGHLQITRCTDNACELLYIALQDNVTEKSN